MGAKRNCAALSNVPVPRGLRQQQQQQCPCTQQVRWYAQVIFGKRAQKPVRAATSDQSLLNGTWRGRAAPPRAQGKRQRRLCCCRVCAAALRLSSAKQQQLRHNRQQQFRLMLDAVNRAHCNFWTWRGCARSTVVRAAKARAASAAPALPACRAAPHGCNASKVHLFYKANDSNATKNTTGMQPSLGVKSDCLSRSARRFCI